MKRLTSYKKIYKDLAIPRVLLKSNSRYCKAVQIFYELKVEAILAGLHQSVKLFFPITIGSIPLIIDPSQTVDMKIPMPGPSEPLRDDCANPSAPLLESREFRKVFVPNFK